jgi:hypothetical protein
MQRIKFLVRYEQEALLIAQEDRHSYDVSVGSTGESFTYIDYVDCFADGEFETLAAFFNFLGLVGIRIRTDL